MQHDENMTEQPQLSELQNSEAPARLTDDSVNEQPTAETPSQVVVGNHHRSKKWLWLLGLTVLVLLIAAVYWFGARKAAAPVTSTNSHSSQTTKPSASSSQLNLDMTKNYGNKYADGLLPVGDGKYSSSTAKVGYVYTCSGYAQNLQTESGGAGKRGPWFTNNNTQYDISKKAAVRGSVGWTAAFTNNISGTTRTITTNDLPDHTTGVFPIAATDPAYQYDKNPNHITAQNLMYALATTPTYSATPNCMGGQSGIMLSGIALFNGFDAGGRDAGAWEVQDSCSGHPQSQGEYHYHTLSSCIKDVSVRSVIGFALDGFPITGPQLSANNILTTSDLDACHGITSDVVVDGKTVTTYHYVMTQDFPYSVSCFRGMAIQPPDEKPLPH